MRKSTVWIWQYGKRKDDYKVILNYVRKLMKNKLEKEAGKGPNFLKSWYRFMETAAHPADAET